MKKPDIFLYSGSEAITLKVIEQTQEIFLSLFQNLRQTIEQDWQARLVYVPPILPVFWRTKSAHLCAPRI